MKHNKSIFSLTTGLSLLLTAAAAGAAQASATSTPADSAQSRYRAERAACLQGRSSQTRETCLKEAGAALAEARRAKPGAQAQPDYLANALARCERVPAVERVDCERLVRGQGSSSGSVAEGAIVRKIISKSVVPAASAASAP
ncbi:hypothetical protein OOZ63_07795 [Paucibacter sp. PLA-PC-4]|uniref:hypothetical protein n=1 Tax=Paucibacter sp. PLA-PC-4 TaxID=2993655 RepID=UPI0022487748|nr:hypothetical protein [Paucibacter sp. PLA-PC-4]MCX2861738.1 hypothetical protein [Paucibacter sp. PLA-PC-4]